MKKNKDNTFLKKMLLLQYHMILLQYKFGENSRLMTSESWSCRGNWFAVEQISGMNGFSREALTSRNAVFLLHPSVNSMGNFLFVALPAAGVPGTRSFRPGDPGLATLPRSGRAVCAGCEEEEQEQDSPGRFPPRENLLPGGLCAQTGEMIDQLFADMPEQFHVKKQSLFE